MNQNIVDTAMFVDNTDGAQGSLAGDCQAI